MEEFPKWNTHGQKNNTHLYINVSHFSQCKVTVWIWLKLGRLNSGFCFPKNFISGKNLHYGRKSIKAG